MAIQQQDFENTFETLSHEDLNLSERLQNEPTNILNIFILDKELLTIF